MILDMLAEIPRLAAAMFFVGVICLFAAAVAS